MKLADSFLRAYARVGPGPCQLCCHFDRCQAERLACRDFQRYTNMKRPLKADVDRYPDALIYDYVYGHDE